MIEGMNPWHFLWIGIILSEIFTFMMNSLLSVLWWGHISYDLLVIGTIDAFVVALLVSLVIIYFVNRIREANITNERLLKEITEREKAEKELQVAHDEIEIRVKHRTLELEEALNNVKLLSGLIPICSNCKKIRDDKGYWNQIESYIDKHSEASFTHGICPDCLKRDYGVVYKETVPE